MAVYEGCFALGWEVSHEVVRPFPTPRQPEAFSTAAHIFVSDQFFSDQKIKSVFSIIFRSFQTFVVPSEELLKQIQCPTEAQEAWGANAHSNTSHSKSRILKSNSYIYADDLYTQSDTI